MAYKLEEVPSAVIRPENQNNDWFWYCSTAALERLKRALMVYRLGYINLTVYLFLFPFMLEDTALVLGDQVQGAAYFELSLLDRTTQQ
ncbi:hypothetical protein SAMN04490186_5160 [Pseudomonas grimontii]|jgi:hypothetical protein|uniref:Uncharacterized protein n=2 Tax=Pseudomonas TaxID=286 RepID=A0A5E6P212_PSEFL|nr:hypothetical protein SAMN04490186_5160 [Pseudomonas grimontii]VVM37238.1 hypothetical protein PS662_00097 [Pseudomonas fluorescens]VVM74556.1 hypothetical protein PS645_01939 [Pseudomonas fluorescens]VVM94930.1 hypothetical protein PS662_03030 [Pseudomonas fluorescens]VVQ11217.1 hypothetical protein PS928_03716 [Pseudomonas fluorescens]